MQIYIYICVSIYIKTFDHGKIVKSLNSAPQNDEKNPLCSLFPKPQISISVYKKNNIVLFLPSGFKGGKKITENGFNFTFLDVEVIGGYVLYTPIKQKRVNTAIKTLKEGSLSFFTPIEKIYLLICTSEQAGNPS